MDTDKRNFTQSKNIVLQLHIYTPNIKSIRKLLPVKIENVGLNIDDDYIDDTDNNELRKSRKDFSLKNIK
jgi:hypothetical protein